MSKIKKINRLPIAERIGKAKEIKVSQHKIKNKKKQNVKYTKNNG